MFGLAVFGTPKSPKTIETELCSHSWKSELFHLLFGGILPRSFAALSAPRNRASAIDVISNRVFVEPLPVGYPTEYWVKKDLYLANSLYWCSNYLCFLSAGVIFPRSRKSQISYPCCDLQPSWYNAPCWRCARAVEWGGLENRCSLRATVGSNPTLSASSGAW